MKIGLALICYQRYDCVEQNCRILSQYKNLFESLIVVDDGSLKKQNTYGIKLIQGKNKGVACNKNRALYFLKNCDLIFLIEDDMKIKNLYFLKVCQEYFQNSRQQALFYDSDIFIWKKLWKIKSCGEFGEVVEYTDLSPYNYFFTPGGFTAITKKGLQIAGGLNADFIGLGLEHMEWSWRISSLGLSEDNLKNYKTLNLKDSLEKFNVKRNIRDEYWSNRNKLIYDEITNKKATFNGDYLHISNLFLKGSKVFGIGLSKTGTNSLNSALNKLGLQSVHYPMYKNLLSEINSKLEWSILTKYDAVTDITAAAHFCELDTLYPGSKFILTTREKNSWIRSMKWHWNYGHSCSPFDKNQNKLTPLTKYLLDSCYQGLTWDANRIWNSYKFHEIKVIEYFNERKYDLLVLPIEETNKWKHLCNLLKTKIPKIDYPHEGISQIKI